MYKTSHFRFVRCGYRFINSKLPHPSTPAYFIFDNLPAKMKAYIHWFVTPFIYPSAVTIHHSYHVSPFYHLNNIFVPEKLLRINFRIRLNSLSGRNNPLYGMTRIFIYFEKQIDFGKGRTFIALVFAPEPQQIRRYIPVRAEKNTDIQLVGISPGNILLPAPE